MDSQRDDLAFLPSLCFHSSLLPSLSSPSCRSRPLRRFILAEAGSEGRRGRPPRGRGDRRDGPVKPRRPRRWRDATDNKDQAKAQETSPLSPSSSGILSLLQVLVQHKVAASDTCQTLITQGRVEVNGEIIQDPKWPVDVEKDHVSAGGMSVTSPSSSSTPEGDEEDEEWWMENGPRSRRDFPKSRAIDKAQEIGRRFTNKVDDGFLAQWSRPRKRKGK